jgi:beta-glucanase (GH16 family)
MTSPRRRSRLLLPFCILVVVACGGGGSTGTESNVTILLQQTSVALTVGETATLSSTVSGSSVSGVKWRSAAPAVASVDNAGIVTAVAPGSTTITALAVADTLQRATASVNVIARDWQLIWSDEFDGALGAAIDASRWRHDIGTSYPGGAANWGTGEIETMTNDPANVSLDGDGHLRITPIRSGDGRWTSARIETERNDFQPSGNGLLAVEASIWQPNVTPANGLGYWPAFWMLGGPFRGNYTNWPSVGEIDILESINARSAVFSTFHCGPSIPGTCNEPTGRGSGEQPCPGCLTGFHTYRMEWDRSRSPQQLRWYLDGTRYFTLRQDMVDAAAWNAALYHGYMIILNVAIGGGFPAAFGGGPTFATISGVPMLVDFVRVYRR